MKSTITYSALMGLFGTLSVLAAPLVPSNPGSSLPVAPSATNSDAGGTAAGAAGGAAGGAAAGFACQDEKHFIRTGVEPAGEPVPCQGDTVCKDGLCVWPEGYGQQPAGGAPGGAAQGATAQGATAQGATAQGATAQGATAQGATAQGATAQGASSTSGALTASGSANPTASSAVSSAGAPGGAVNPSGSSGLPSGSSGVPSQTGPSASAGSTASASGGKTSGSSTPSGSGSNAGGTRFVGYWENYSNLGGVEKTQMNGLTHVILSFVDMNSWTSATSTFAVSSNGNFDQKTAADLRTKQPGVKVTAALGGWALDGPIKTAADGGDAALTQFIENAKGVVTQWDLDGLDLDWEFPTAAQQPAFVAMCKGLKKAITEVKPDGILSVAIGSRSTQSDPSTGAKDVDAMTPETFSELNDVVDMWNVMTYDFVNRYDEKTGHQGGGKVVEETMEFYQTQGIAMDKVNIGFLNTAKYFLLNDTATPQCSAQQPIGCPMGGRKYFETAGKDNGMSGWLRYNAELDSGLGEFAAINAEMRAKSWSSKPADTETAFAEEKAHAWYDEKTKVFWTWTSPEDNKAICQDWKSKVGGVMVWSMNQDEQGPSGGPHMQALADCVGGA